ncbi:hypothetical protein BRAS3843_100052 [Bradyrhizobium sp. STM 3843]|nr:hypothetical protein BRAS3843_100052 [Bradyrhizobium sp. STM 3843]
MTFASRRFGQQNTKRQIRSARVGFPLKAAYEGFATQPMTIWRTLRLPQGARLMTYDERNLRPRRP